MQKPVALVAVPPPPLAQRACRGAAFAAEGERRTRYHLPDRLHSASPIGYRVRLSLSAEESMYAAALFAIEPPESFSPADPVTEQELFEETALGIMSARQSTNYRGHREVILGPEDSATLGDILRRLDGLDRPVLDGAAYTHVVFCRPYRTPFTFLLTFIGHAPVASLLTVPLRAWRKRFGGAVDIPTIGYLQQLHVGVLADAMERAALLASAGVRRANILLRPFAGAAKERNREVLAEVGALVGLTRHEVAAGWEVALVAQCGKVGTPSPIPPALCRKLAANVVALRSERIQPGVNAEAKSPEQYRARQDMDVPGPLVEMAGRAAYNAFCRWSGADRERAKDLLLLERIDVMTPGGKERLRAVRSRLEDITDRLVADLPAWADLPTGKALSKNAARGKKAFALAGQRIYVGGLSPREVEAAGIDFDLAVRALGAAAARGALVAEIAGCIDIPPGCDLTAGICLMAGPVNQGDVGKQFYGYDDLLDGAFPGVGATSLLVWTLKAKTVADPIGNEEQLLEASRKGALVDLRPGPHEVISLRIGGRLVPMRRHGDRVNGERAFADQANFVRDGTGREIPGNRGSSWPRAWQEEWPW